MLRSSLSAGFTIGIGLSLGFTLALGALPAAAESSGNVIPDPALAKCINQTISHRRAADTPITQEEISQVTDLFCGNNQVPVKNLQGLDQAVNLRTLTLDGNQITDLSPLSELSQLRYLTAADNLVKDSTPLTKLTNLTYLNLNNNQLSELKGVSALTKVTSLNLQGNQLTQIQELSGLPELFYVDLANNSIRDFRPLAGSKTRTSLYPQRAYVRIDLPAYQPGMSIDLNLSAADTEAIITPQGEEIALASGSYQVVLNTQQDYENVLSGTYVLTAAEQAEFQVLLLGIPASPSNPETTPDPETTPKPNLDGKQPGKPDAGKLSFSDIAGYPFVKEIEWLASTGVTTGYPDKTFRPHDSVSRAAMAAFLYRLEGKPDYKAPAKSPFTDIKPGDDFYKEICWLASKGITTGYADKSFKPWDSISREAMAAFLHRYDSKVAKAKLTVKNSAAAFSDAQSSIFAKDIAWLSSTGITKGYVDGTFRPYDPIERGAIAAFFYRMKH